MKILPDYRTGASTPKNTCPRCGGRLVAENFVDVWGTCEPHTISACRCMNCGNVVDELILHHQKTPPPRPIKGGSHSPDR